MIAKAFEVRDSATFIPVLAVKMEGNCNEQRYLLRRAGYGGGTEALIMLTRLDGGGKAEYDPYEWPREPRTMPVAHQYISEHFDQLLNGAVVDVEFILGLTAKPKVSEAVEYPT